VHIRQAQAAWGCDIHVCVCVCVYIYIYIYTHTYIHMRHITLHVCMYIHGINMYAYIYAYMKYFRTREAENTSRMYSHMFVLIRAHPIAQVASHLSQPPHASRPGTYTTAKTGKNRSMIIRQRNGCLVFCSFRANRSLDAEKSFTAAVASKLKSRSANNQKTSPESRSASAQQA
jgi:hypothetical protein